MAFNKIQPEQIQMATFFSESGSLNITQTSTGLQINLSSDLTGDFSFTGSLSTNGKEVFGLANTGNNIFSVQSGNLMLLGSDTEMGASVNDGNNVCILANDSLVSGSSNVILHGDNIEFGTGSMRNTLLAGNNVTFSKPATGCVVIKDGKNDTFVTASNPHSLYINFGSGHFFERGETYFETHASFDGSGIFSGDLEVLGGGDA